MVRTLNGLLIAATLLLVLDFSSAPGQVPDGTVKITSRMVAPGIGLSWGEGVLTYKSRDYPFTFKAAGLFRDIDSQDRRCGDFRSGVRIEALGGLQRKLPEG